MKNKWKITGLVATLLIVAVIPLQLVKFYLDKTGDADSFPTFTGTESCIECHRIEYDLWLGSDHDRAMMPAKEGNVEGDFNDAVLEYNGFENRFFRRDDRYFVHTQGPGGEPGDFEISYTFGVRPLQQYLVEFDGGKFQCLPIAWDTEKKQWFHLVPIVYDDAIPSDDWLYWTNFGQNWNGMCADCHSTNLRKNLDPGTMEFHTEWTDINVGCEACHGPGSAHLDWARLPEGDRPMDVNTALVVKTSNIANREYIDNCARCHSRRSVLSDFDNRSTEFLDYYVPQQALSPLYFNDGQILEEDYVYASFLQSKMYMKDVRCSDCHNAHSLKFIKEGNDLCLQCHRADQYDTYSHHFHKMNGREHQPQAFNSPPQYIEGEGARCINCHMDGRYYMGVDYRRDHSFRIPRPDLTLSIGVPNACNSCHKDKNAQWSQDYIVKWYGISQRPHYGTAFAAGETSDTSVLDDLCAIVSDELEPPMVRASAMGILNNYSDTLAGNTLHRFMGYTDPLLRVYAARELNPGSRQEIIDTYVPLLYDPVKPVRMEAAMRLSSLRGDLTDSLQLIALDKAIGEYKDAMYYTADFAASRHNLGNLYMNLGETAQAEKEYKMALVIDDHFYPARINLATVLNSLGKNQEAEQQLKTVLEANPEVTGVYYSLGLLLAEMNKFDEALTYLKKATEESPQNARVFYNYGLLLNQGGKQKEAEKALLRAIDLDPANPNFIYAISTFYLQNNDREKALKYAEELSGMLPGDPSVQQYLQDLKR